MLVGVAGEEIKISSCLPALLHNEFISAVLQVTRKVSSASSEIIHGKGEELLWWQQEV